MQIEEDLNLTIKWGKNVFHVVARGCDTIEILKAQLYSVTLVLPEKQKLMYKGKFLKDDIMTLSNVGLIDVR